VEKKAEMVDTRRIAVTPPRITNDPRLRAAVAEALPNAVFHDSPVPMGEDELIVFLKDFELAIMGFEPITDKVLAALPNLKLISKFGAGYESINFEALRKHGVRFAYTWGVNKLAVAELALGFMLATQRWTTSLNQAMRAGGRPRPRDGRLLTGRTVGIHGCGNIGKEVVRLLAPFQCQVLATDIKDYSDFYRAHNVTPVPMEELLARSEVLTLHLPKTRQTAGLYDRATLGKLRADCTLINTCRGGIVDEDALLERLNAGALMAAAFDVFAIEPAVNDALLRHPNMLSTPHIGASAVEIRMSSTLAAVRGLYEATEVDPSVYDAG
jgi:D-3-phosphoglycerate dehydrogenase